jgi:hypothetical protein
MQQFKEQLMRISQSQAGRLEMAASLGLVSATVLATPTISSVLVSYSTLSLRAPASEMTVVRLTTVKKISETQIAA